jgi:hypothetical protein
VKVVPAWCRGYRRSWLVSDVLAALAEDLERDGVALILAREVGQVRDILSVAEGDRPRIRTYASVHAAVEAASQL